MMSACESRGAQIVPDVAEPVAVPVPRPIVPAQVADVEVLAVGDAEHRAPEVDVAGAALSVGLPLLGDEVRVVEERVEDVRVEHRLAGELLTKIVALDDRARLLPLGEVEDHLLAVDVQAVLPLLDADPAFALVIDDFGAVERELRLGLEVDLDRRGVDHPHALGLLVLDAERLQCLDELRLAVGDEPRQDLYADAHLRERVADEGDELHEGRHETADDTPVSARLGLLLILLQHDHSFASSLSALWRTPNWLLDVGCSGFGVRLVHYGFATAFKTGILY